MPGIGLGWFDRFTGSSTINGGLDNSGANTNGNTTECPSDTATEQCIKKGPVPMNNNHHRSENGNGCSSHMPPADAVLEYRHISDLNQLEKITLDNVVSCLVERFYSKEYYTFAGSVLISLNPCKNISRTQFLDVECMSIMTQYYFNLKTEEKNLRPHVYSIGLKSLKSLRTVGNNQVIIVSGDSGAGKTTSTQQLIRYFTETNQVDNLYSDETIIVNNLEKKIYFATVVLESFGNASTIANPNSSRFGRLVQLSYDTKSNISGAEIKTFLLEKHRVAKGSSSERNFHIFYYLLAGLEMGKFKIEEIGDEWKENESEQLTDEFQDSDRDNMLHFFNALKVLNVMAEFQDIFRVVFAIMKLRTVEFTSKREDEQLDCSIEDQDDDIPINAQFTFKTWAPLNTACSILGIPVSSILHAILTRKITAGEGRRQSIIHKPCDSEAECTQRMHDFIILVYDKIFTHVLAKLNNLLRENTGSATARLTSTPVHRSFGGAGDCSGRTNLGLQGEWCSKASTTIISILDLYGFENLEYNHLEQMCINYANERLQQIHISALKIDMDFTFEEPLELNRVEKEIEIRINELHRMFSFLNEECVLKRTSDDRHIFERMAEETNSNEFISCERFLADECPFTVRHYATDVRYNFRGIPAKNKDYIPPEFGDLLSSSTNCFVRSMFKEANRTLGSALTPNHRTPRSNINERRKTILKRFETSVNELVKELQQDDCQDLHFVRCIRPNNNLQEGKVQREVLQKQLYTCGIVDVIRIAGNGYPIRVKFSKFEKIFPVTFRQLTPEKLVQVFSSEKRLMKVSESNMTIFMNEKCWALVRKTESTLANKYAKTLQNAVRKFLVNRQQIRANVLSPPSRYSSLADSNSSDDETIWFTPAMTLSRSSLISPVPGPFGDWRSDVSFASTLKDEDSFNTITAEDTVDVPKGERTLIDSSDHDTDNENLGSKESTVSKLCEATRGIILEPNVSNVPKRSYYSNGNGIVSRNPIHSLPMKFYTKKTALGCLKPPQRLVANGIEDCLTEHGIIMDKNFEV